VAVVILQARVVMVELHLNGLRDGDELDSVASQDITPEQAFELLTQYPLRSKNK
jgi:hypothetical protein